MNELTQAQYITLFGVSNQDPLFQHIIDEYYADVPYTLRKLDAWPDYPMVYFENLPAELAEMCPPIEQYTG